MFGLRAGDGSGWASGISSSPCLDPGGCSAWLLAQLLHCVFPSSPQVVGFAPSAAGLAGDGDAGVPAVPQTELAVAPTISVLQKNKGDELLPALRHHEHRHGVKAELPTCSGNESAKKNSVLSCA